MHKRRREKPPQNADGIRGGMCGKRRGGHKYVTLMRQT